MKGHHLLSHQRWLFSQLTLVYSADPKTSPTPSSWKRSTLLKCQFISSYLPLTRFNDLLLRCRELDTWTQDLTLPAVVWLSGFFNPQSFLTGMAGSKGWGGHTPGRSPAWLYLLSFSTSLQTIISKQRKQ